MQPWQGSFAFGIKTGSVTTQQRVPMQMLAFLAGIRTHILIGTEPGVLSASEFKSQGRPGLSAARLYADTAVRFMGHPD